MDSKDTPKAFKWLKIIFDLSTMLLTNMTTFRVAVGATIVAVKVKDEDGCQRQHISIEF
jgi:hypothetical protein